MLKSKKRRASRVRASGNTSENTSGIEQGRGKGGGGGGSRRGHWDGLDRRGRFLGGWANALSRQRLIMFQCKVNSFLFVRPVVYSGVEGKQVSRMEVRAESRPGNWVLSQTRKGQEIPRIVGFDRRT